MTGRSLNVLIIDDQPDQHVLYQDYLGDDRHCSYTFWDAYTGEEGERIFNENIIDCVLLDYQLPDIDGLEVLRRLMRTNDIVPAIMLTGEGNESIAVVAMQNGSQDYIPKRVVTAQALRRTVTRTAERACMVKRMEHYKRDLERSNSDLERFANVLAHDLKSPLRAITQHLELIQANMSDTLDEKNLASMNFVIDGAVRMRSLIDALFSFSKVGFEKRSVSPVNCNMVMEQVTSNLATEIARCSARVTHDDLPTLMANHMQLMQLLQNLIANSLKFCVSQPHIHVSATYKPGHWEFSVHDNGIGIPPSQRENIFNIFKRLHREEEYPGTGVGLAICERVVQNHGGRIWVESELGQGSTFRFVIPEHESLEQRVA